MVYLVTQSFYLFNVSNQLKYNTQIFELSFVLNTLVSDLEWQFIISWNVILPSLDMQIEVEQNFWENKLFPDWKKMKMIYLCISFLWYINTICLQTIKHDKSMYVISLIFQIWLIYSLFFALLSIIWNVINNWIIVIWHFNDFNCSLDLNFSQNIRTLLFIFLRCQANNTSRKLFFSWEIMKYKYIYFI